MCAYSIPCCMSCILIASMTVHEQHTFIIEGHATVVLGDSFIYIRYQLTTRQQCIVQKYSLSSSPFSIPRPCNAKVIISQVLLAILPTCSCELLSGSYVWLLAIMITIRPYWPPAYNHYVVEELVFPFNFSWMTIFSIISIEIFPISYTRLSDIHCRYIFLYYVNEQAWHWPVQLYRSQGLWWMLCWRFVVVGFLLLGCVSFQTLVSTGYVFVSFVLMS